MKKICKLLAAATACFALFCSCNDEWEGEQYEKYVSFVKCGVDNAKVYFKYDALGGEKQYRIPVMVSGSSTNNRDVNVVIALDADTLDAYNYSRFQNRTDLYYQLLPEDKYNFPKMSGVIPKGADVGYVDVNFQFQGLDLKHEYILPLQITEASDLAPNPRKYYKKTLMNVVLFNDYSGTYNIAGDLFVLNSGGNKDGEAIMVETVPYAHLTLPTKRTV